MARRTTLNERRLTKRQLQELIASDRRLRPELTVALDKPVLESCVYELPGDRFLLVFGGVSGLTGQGDIYAGDNFRRFCASVREHRRRRETWTPQFGQPSGLIFKIDGMVAQLRSTISRTPVDLDFSCKSLDLVSEYIEGIGIERAEQELYDQLVAYIGEVPRSHVRFCVAFSGPSGRDA